MKNYRKKPVVIQAEQFWPDKRPWPEGVKSAGNSPMPDEVTGFGFATAAFTGPEEFYIDTLEGRGVPVQAGDWIITGVAGERYPCKSDIFEATYEPA